MADSHSNHTVNYLAIFIALVICTLLLCGTAIYVVERRAQLQSEDRYSMKMQQVAAYVLDRHTGKLTHFLRGEKQK